MKTDNLVSIFPISFHGIRPQLTPTSDIVHGLERTPTLGEGERDETNQP